MTDYQPGELETWRIGGVNLTGPPEILAQVKVIELPGGVAHAAERASEGLDPPHTVSMSAWSAMTPDERASAPLLYPAGVLVMPDELMYPHRFGRTQTGVTYDQQFYDVIRDGAQRSVEAALPIIIDALGLPEGDGSFHVLDVGCGEGWWADGFARAGFKVDGIDSGYTGNRPDTFQFLQHDLMNPLPKGTWDLIVCMEVAEHLPYRRAASFVAELCERSDTVLFSAARPGQGGTGHINEQPITYWFELFEQQGMDVSATLRWHLWGHPDIENWYQQNMLVAMRDACHTNSHAPRDGGGTYTVCHPLFGEPLLSHPHDVVHPILFDARRS